ncbi:hypothetical protein G9A89_001976 [Geosiphon pyriformis]|nr:hypothetical protein G9A89_001976 [Geosiphon pyriformis]
MSKIQLNDWMTLRELLQPTNMIMSTSFKLLVTTSKALLLPGSHKKLMLMPIKESLDKCQQMPEKTTPLLQPGLRTDLSYALWPLLALKDNPTMDMAIELAQRIKDNQRM